MSLPTIYETKTVVTRFIGSNTVEFVGRKLYPGSIQSVWTTSGECTITIDGTSAFVRKKYTSPVNTDKVMLITTLDSGQRYVTIFNVTVLQQTYELTVHPQFMMLTGAHTAASPRSVTYNIRTPPVVLSAVIKSVVWEPDVNVVPPVPYTPPTPTVSISPSNLNVNVQLGEEGTAMITIGIVFVEPYLGTIGDDMVLRVTTHRANRTYNGHPAIGYALHVMSYDRGSKSEIALRLLKDPTPWLDPSLLILNTSNIGEFMDADGVIDGLEYYTNGIDYTLDRIRNRLIIDPIINMSKDGSFLKFYHPSRAEASSSLPRLHIVRTIDFDGGTRRIRNDISMMRVLGFSGDSYQSVEDLATAFQTIVPDRPYLKVTPPIISLDCTLVTTQLEGLINQGESMRLYNFTMGDEQAGYERFTSTISFPARRIPPMYKRVSKLTFRFTCNRLQEISDSVDTEVPVTFVEPYYITFKLEFRMPTASGQDNVSQSYITITGIESEKTVELERALDGLHTIEMMEANIPRSGEAVINPDRSLLLGYIVDESL